MKAIEIYPKILVYRDVFKDPEKTYQILKESTENNDDRLFSKWSKWSIFGEYLESVVPNNLNGVFSLENINQLKASSLIQEQQKNFLIELYEGFSAVGKDYIARFGNEFEFNPEEMTTDHDGNVLPRWKVYGPSICKYSKEWDQPMSMIYHSDYIREPITSPGYKFAITINAYFNDDYDGGEIDFAVGDELYKYKPKMGDWLVFPSGHPEVLAQDGKVYLHGVTSSVKEHKYFARMYWRKYSNGSPEWFAKEEEFGKEVWASMQDKIMEEYRKTIPNRYEITEGKRIENEFNK